MCQINFLIKMNSTSDSTAQKVKREKPTFLKMDKDKAKLNQISLSSSLVI